MALTIRMRIDENDEHSYYYATGDGTQIELIPLVVNANGEYVPAEGKAYNRVTVTVPETELETLVVDANGTYNAPDGKAYNVVQVNVQSVLEAVTRSYTENGTYTIEPSEGFDGISGVTINIDVPTGGGGDVVTLYKRFTPSVTDSVFAIDLSAEAPQNKSLLGFIIRPASGTFGSITSGSGRNIVICYEVTRDVDDNTKWFKFWLYKGAVSTPTGGGVRSTLPTTPNTTPAAVVVGYDPKDNSIKIYCKMISDTSSSSYGFASYCPYELFAFYK